MHESDLCKHQGGHAPRVLPLPVGRHQHNAPSESSTRLISQHHGNQQRKKLQRSYMSIQG